MTSGRSIALVFLCTLLTSLAQILYKLGVSHIPSPLPVIGIAFVLSLWPIWLGLCLYGVGAIVLILALRGGDLSVLYPIIATGYVWVALMSWLFYDDPVGIWGWLGIALILLGVSYIGIGSRPSSAVADLPPGGGP